MRYKQLGRSGLVVSDLCLGTMIFGETGSRGTPPDEAERMIHRYLDAGGNHLDTADVYAGGRSEEVVGQTLKGLGGRRGQIILATKVRFATEDDPNGQGLSRHHIVEGVHASLRRLQTDYIDLYYMHCWDPLTPLDESLRAFEDLVRDGKVRYIGVSNFKAWQLMKALAVSDTHGWVRFVAAEYQYSLVKRDIEYEFSDLCTSEGVSVTAWGPLGGGFLSGKYRPDQRPQSASEGRIATSPDNEEESWARRDTERNWAILDVVGQIANARGASYAQIALAWLRAQPFVASVILGARTLEQLDDNLRAAEIALTDDELSRMDRASALPELYPYRMIEYYGKRSL